MRKVAVVVALGILLVGCGSDKTSNNTPSGSGGSGSSSGAVSASDSQKFTPDSVMISVGGTVKWSNTGQIPHTVTFDSGPSFDQQLPAGGSVSRTFASAGTFTYHCNIHGPSMHGTVVVK